MTQISQYLALVDEVIEKGPFKDNWESLSAFKMPSWYRPQRFGLFIHWGAYSVPATQNEWYPRLTYQKGTKSYNHRIKTYGENCEYRQIVSMFKPEKFNADEWVSLFKQSGAKYIMPVGEHHDGVKMYESSLNEWNMMHLNGRDYMKELHDACDRQDMGFCISNHRAEHYWFMNNARKYCPDSEVAKNLYPELYGPAYCPPGGNPDKTDKEITATEEWLEDWLASACEMIDRNQPLAVYFDWWVHKSEFRPYMKKFLAYYYNRGVQWGKEVGVFYKVGAVMDGCAIFDVERGQIDGVSRQLWQNDTAIAKNSWGYTENNAFKTSNDIIKNMIEVVSKNGCYMLNVGPKPDGTVCDEEKKVLLAIGKWLAINGDAIYDSNPFEVSFGEGKSSKNGSFKENKKFGSHDYRFTAKPGKIFVFPMGEKLPSKIRIKSLRRHDSKGIRYDILGVKLLGQNNKVTFNQSERYLELFIDGSVDQSAPLCFQVDVD